MIFFASRFIAKDDKFHLVYKIIPRVCLFFSLPKLSYLHGVRGGGGRKRKRDYCEKYNKNIFPHSRNHLQVSTSIRLNKIAT